MKMNRRVFLGSAAAAAGGALVIGFSYRKRFHFGKGGLSDNPFEAWIHIKPDNGADLVFAQSEMGQGVYTALPMLLADEADLDWDHVRIVQSDCTRWELGGERQREEQLRQSSPGGRGGARDDAWRCGAQMGRSRGRVYGEQEPGAAQGIGPPCDLRGVGG